MQKMLKVFTADNIVEVGLMRSMLAQHDIETELRNDHSASVMGEIPFTSVWPEIWVSQRYFDRAVELIKSLQRRELSGPDWRCSKCEEPNPISFELCWQCATPNT